MVVYPRYTFFQSRFCDAGVFMCALELCFASKILHCSCIVAISGMVTDADMYLLLVESGKKKKKAKAEQQQQQQQQLTDDDDEFGYGMPYGGTGGRT